jgi:hypothetical protein
MLPPGAMVEHACVQCEALPSKSVFNAKPSTKVQVVKEVCVYLNPRP